MLIFYFLGAIALWLGIASLRSGFQFSKFVQGELARPLPDFTPPVTVIAPCRGLDQGFSENLEALFQQNYPSYEIIFVSDRADDPALSALSEIRARRETHSSPKSKIVIAGPARESGQSASCHRRSRLS